MICIDELFYALSVVLSAHVNNKNLDMRKVNKTIAIA